MTEILLADSVWFEERLKLRGLSKRALAKQLGMTPGTLSNILHGKNRLRIIPALRMARAIAVPLEEFLSRAGVPMPPTTRPILGTVTDESFEIHPYDRFATFSELPYLPSAAACIVCRQPASPFHGWIFIYDPTPPLIHVEAIGRLAVIQLPDGRRVLRFLRTALERGKFDLVNLFDGDTIHDAEIVSAAPVIHIRP